MDVISHLRTYTFGKFHEATIRVREREAPNGIQLQLTSVHFEGQNSIDIFCDKEGKVCIAFVDRDGNVQDHILGNATTYLHIHEEDE